MANSRAKDFWDIWTIIHTYDLDAKAVAQAIEATFERRKTKLPTETPVALTSMFYDNPDKQKQWEAFIRKTRAKGAPKRLKETNLYLKAFFAPIIEMFKPDWQSMVDLDI